MSADKAKAAPVSFHVVKEHEAFEKLSIEETKRLRKLENVIDKGQTIFVAVGSALSAIKETKLYRASHQTFEAYARDRFGFHKSRLYQLIQASEIMRDLSTRVDIHTSKDNVANKSEILPASEKQVRPLTALPSAEDRRKAWDSAALNSKTGIPTASDVARAVEKLQQQAFIPITAPSEATVKVEEPPVPQEATHLQQFDRLWNTYHSVFRELLQNCEASIGKAGLDSIRQNLTSTKKALQKALQQPT